MLLPAWTKDTAESAWRDPLRLYRVGQRLLGALMPSFTAVTAHAPYYWLYPWAVWVSEDQSATELRRLVLNVEKAYVLATKRAHAPDSCPLETGMQGTSLIDSSALDSTAASLADISWLGNIWGGLGQQYLGALERTGLLERVAGVPHVTDLGIEVSVRADAVLAQTPLRAAATRGSVSDSELSEIATVCCPCRVADGFTDVASAVVEAWERVNASERGGNSQKNLLDLLRFLDGVATEHAVTITDAALRGAIYSGVWRHNSGSLELAFPEQLEPVRQTLRMIQASHYAVHAVEAAFRGALLAVRDDELGNAQLVDDVLDLLSEQGMQVSSDEGVASLWSTLDLPPHGELPSEEDLDTASISASSPHDCVGYAFMLLLLLLRRFGGVQPALPGKGSAEEIAWAALQRQSYRSGDDFSFVHLYNRWRGLTTHQAIRDLANGLALERHRHYVMERGVPSLWISYGGLEASESLQFQRDYDLASADRPSWRVGNIVWMMKGIGHWKSRVQYLAESEEDDTESTEEEEDSEA